MNTTQKQLALAVGLGILILLVGGVIGKTFFVPSSLGHGGAYESANYPQMIGSASVPATITSDYNGASSTIKLVGGQPNAVFGGTFTPKSYGSKLYLLVQRSIDDGATFLPYDVISVRSTSTVIYTSGASSTQGIPFVIPDGGDTLSASGTSIGFSFDLTAAADYIRVFAKEDTTSTEGTLNVQMQTSSN